MHRNHEDRKREAREVLALVLTLAAAFGAAYARALGYI